MPTTKRLLVYLVFLVLLAGLGPTFCKRDAKAHDALAWVDPERDAWFRSLKMPGTGGSCCSLDDCEATDARQLDDGSWEAIVNGEWTPIPPDREVKTPLSIDGSAFVCNSPTGTIYCFVPAIPGF